MIEVGGWSDLAAMFVFCGGYEQMTNSPLLHHWRFQVYGSIASLHKLIQTDFAGCKLCQAVKQVLSVSSRLAITCGTV